jgi:outer membrane receptor for ferrienterochelin and colicins
MRTKYVSYVLLLLNINLIFSQKQAIDTTKTEQLGEVVISAQFKPVSEKNAIYKVKVLNAKTIDNKASNNLRELLQQELNIDLTQSSVFGSSIELQGISKENIKILVDGTPIIGRLNGIVDLSQINLLNIERIEIIEGPVSVFYGTDAMGGIINLISKKSQKETVEGNVSLYYESINATNLNGNIGYKFGENTIQINAGNYKFNGLSTNDAPRNLNWEEKDQYFANLMYNRKINNLQLRFNSNFSNEKLISIGEPDRFGNIKDKDYYTRRIDNSLNLRGKAFNNKFIEATVSYLDYQRYHNTFDVDPNTFNSVKASSDNKNDNIVRFNYGGFKAQLGKSEFGDKLNYAFGTDIKTESTKGERILDEKQDIQTYAFFTSVNYKLLENFEIQPAVRYTYNSTYGSLISPALNSKITINNNSNIRFSYARGFRAPSLKELFLDFHISQGPFTFIISGNQDLNVEKSHSFNLQYSYHKTLTNNKSFTIEPSVFYNDVSELITLSELVNFNRHYINIDKFKSVGGKVDFSYKYFERFTFKTGISVVGRYNKFNEEFESDEFLYAPEITSNVNYKFQTIGVNLDVFYKYTGKRTGFFIDDDTNSLVKTRRDKFNNLDATISKSFLKNKLKASFGVKNILDVEDIETLNQVGESHARDLQLWGRSVFVKTTFKF